MQMADHLASDGFKDVGYEYVNIDVSITNWLAGVKVHQSFYLMAIYDKLAQ